MFTPASCLGIFYKIVYPQFLFWNNLYDWLYLQVVLFRDEHGFQCVEGALLLLVGDKDAALLAVERAVHTGNRSKLNNNKIIKNAV